MHGILSDLAIRQAIEVGDIQIDPFTPEQLNVTSYDLTLGSGVLVYKGWATRRERKPAAQPPGEDFRWELIEARKDGHDLHPGTSVRDVRVPLETIRYEIDTELGWVLQPGIGYLMHTRERIATRKYNPILDGKSSIGRLFIQVHATAGYGDPGFDGQYTLEVIVQHPIRVYPGMRICQIRFHTIAGELSKTYDQVGHYTGVNAQGANPSQAWRQFKT